MKNSKLQNDFQARSTREGRTAQDVARKILQGCGFQIEEPSNRPHPELGVTINFSAFDHDGGLWYFDVVGSFTSQRSGLLRTDSVWKALGRASVMAIGGLKPVILLTTNLPRDSTVGYLALKATAGKTFLDAIEMMTADGKARLRYYAKIGTGQRPLPGFWGADQLYGSSLRKSGLGRPSVSVPVNVVGDPLGRIVPEKKVTGLAYRLKVLVPSRTRKDCLIAGGRRAEAVRIIKKMLGDLAGGSTSQSATGSWADPIKGTIDEEVMVIETYAQKEFPKATLSAIVDVILYDLDQEVAAVVMGTKMLQFSRDG